MSFINLPSIARRSPLIFIFITVFIDLMGYGMVIPLLPFFVQKQGAGAAATGALGSLYALMQLISGPMLGALSDRYGRRPVLLGCLFGTAMAYLVLGFAASLTIVFLAIVLDGITGGNLSTAYAYIADVTTNQNRARGLGLVGAAFGLGLMSGPAIGGLLSAHGLSVPAFVACAIALSNMTFGFFVLPESLPLDRRTPLSTWRALNWVTLLVAVFRIRSIRTLLFSIFMLNLAFAGLQTNFPLLSQARFGWDSTRNGVFFAFVGLCAVFVQGILFGWIQPRIGEKCLAVIGLLLMSVSLAAVAVASQGWMMYPIVGLGALGSGTSIPSLTSLVSQRAGAGEQGRLMGGTQVVLSLAMIFGPSIAGVSFEHISPSAPYWIGSLLAGAALALAYMALRAAPANSTPE
jgi:DHA1 family tetracycline resistance protein-like MFS transporter